MSKVELRRHLRQERAALSAASVEVLSMAITERAVQVVDWSGIRLLHTYSPLEQQREVNPNPLVEAIRTRNSAIRVARLRHIRAFWAAVDGRQEPVSAGQQFDVIIVPVLGFTEQCYRLGFGGGFYDRLLAGQHQAVKIGLAYELSLCEFDPEPHDVPLDFIVTEKRLLTRG